MYKLTNYNTVQRLSDNAFIPFNKDNGDYRAYLQWIDKGNKPAEADLMPTPALSSFEQAIILILKNMKMSNNEDIKLQEMLLASLEKR